jgi:hypothetical protein
MREVGANVQEVARGIGFANRIVRISSCRAGLRRFLLSQGCAR